jgi:ribonuclease T2
MHGLWPQYEGTGWPQDCSTERIDPGAVNKMISIMPSASLIQHEWTKHGTCSGLTSAEYFDEATEAYESIRVPAQYKNLATTLSVSPAEVRSQFAAANPQFGERGFVVECSGNGRYLSEVHACLTKEIAGRACNADELSHQCRSASVIMRPVR